MTRRDVAKSEISDKIRLGVKNGMTTGDWGYYCDAYQIICGPLPLTCG